MAWYCCSPIPCADGNRAHRVCSQGVGEVGQQGPGHAALGAPRVPGPGGGVAPVVAVGEAALEDLHGGPPAAVAEGGGVLGRGVATAVGS